MHTCVHTKSCICRCACNILMHTCAHIYIHTSYSNSPMYICMHHPQIHLYTCTHSYACIHTYANMRKHMHVLAYTRTYIPCIQLCVPAYHGVARSTEGEGEKPLIVTKWLSVERLVLRDRSQSQKDKQHTFSLICWI